MQAGGFQIVFKVLIWSQKVSKLLFLSFVDLDCLDKKKQYYKSKNVKKREKYTGPDKKNIMFKYMKGYCSYRNSGLSQKAC